MDVKIEPGWKHVLAPEFEKEYFLQLTNTVRDEYARRDIQIFPPASRIFAAFDLCPFQNTKVVIIGQDPYHGPRQATGLAFSVPNGVVIPPSLRNIFKEVHDDIGSPIPDNGDLSRWAEQGVLLLNASLTVRAHSPKSHANIGWQRFTDAVVDCLNKQKDSLVFLLWGADAIKKGQGIDTQRHLVLTSVHPSPLSAHRGFFGNRHFSAANKWLSEHGKQPIIW